LKKDAKKNRQSFDEPATKEIQAKSQGKR